MVNRFFSQGKAFFLLISSKDDDDDDDGDVGAKRIYEGRRFRRSTASHRHLNIIKPATNDVRGETTAETTTTITALLLHKHDPQHLILIVISPFTLRRKTIVVRLGVSLGVEGGRATPKTAVRLFKGWSARRA
jgi:hypothetical protein